MWEKNCIKKSDLLDTDTVSTIVCFLSAQYKGVRWMPRHYSTKKDVAGCDKPRGGPKQPLIRGFPNGGTHVA